MQQEDRRVGRDGIDLLDRRQALFGELVFGEATDDAHPLRGGCDGHLPLEHVHGVGQRTDAVPAQLHVEVETAPHNVSMVVDQTRQYTFALEINDLCIRSGECHDVAVGTHVDE